MSTINNKEHQPLPWYYKQETPASGCDIYGQGTDSYVATTSGYAVSNAELIVNAVNQHAKLVEALEGVAIMLNTELSKYENEPWAQRVRTALNPKG